MKLFWVKALRYEAEDKGITVGYADPAILRMCEIPKGVEFTLGDDGIEFGEEDTDAVDLYLSQLHGLESKQKALEALNAIKIRICFIGHPKEPITENGPCWAKEIALLENAVDLLKKELI